MVVVKWILTVVVALAMLFFGIALFLPNTVHVERSTVIAAPAATVFTLVNGFVRFNQWSPWADLDPATAYTYDGPTAGVGAKMTWASDDPDVGAGSQEVVASTPWQEVRTRIDFVGEGRADSTLRLAPAAGGVEVTWSFDVDLGFNLVGRWFGLMFDALIGPDYEKGLGRLKTLAESLPSDDWSELDIRVTEVAPVTIAAVRRSCAHDVAVVAPILAAAYAEITRFIAANDLDPAGPPVAVNLEWRTGYTFDAGIPVAGVSDAALSSDGDIRLTTTPGGRVVKAVHVGPRGEVGATFGKIKAFAAVHGLTLAEPAWEEYVSDPATTNEAQLVTNVYYPIG